MKILHIEDHFVPTLGYQLNFLSKYNSLHKHEVYIVTSDSLKPWTNNGFLKNYNLKKEDQIFSQIYGIHIKRFKSIFYYSGREFLQINLKKEIQKIKPDVILVHGLETLTGLRMINLLKKINCPVLFDCHMVEAASKNKNSKKFQAFFKRFITPKLIKNQNTIIAVSKATKEFIIDHYGIPEDLIKIIELGTDDEIFYRDENLRNKTREELKINPSDFLLIYTGKIVRDKKVDMLLKAFDKINKENKKIKLLLVGSTDGDYAQELLTVLKKDKDFIHIDTQPLKELNKYYNAADIAVWPGGCSLSFYDAQVTGLPAILENIDINVERLKYNNGILFEKDNLEDLIDKIEWSFQNDLSSMSLNAIEMVKNSYTYNVLTEKLENIFLTEIDK